MRGIFRLGPGCRKGRFCGPGRGPRVRPLRRNIPGHGCSWGKYTRIAGKNADHPFRAGGVQAKKEPPPAQAGGGSSSGDRAPLGAASAALQPGCHRGSASSLSPAAPGIGGSKLAITRNLNVSPAHEGPASHESKLFRYADPSIILRDSQSGNLGPWIPGNRRGAPAAWVGKPALRIWARAPAAFAPGQTCL